MKMRMRDAGCGMRDAGYARTRAGRIPYLVSRIPNRIPNRIPHPASAFTLIEIMVAIGIVAVILTISFPFMTQQLHKDSMRQAVKDITDACREARQRAILNGTTTEVRIRPGDRTISAIESGGGASPSFGAAAFTEDGEPKVQHRGGGGTIFTAKLSDHIWFEYIGVNIDEDIRDREEISASFYSNGTSDAIALLIKSDRGEVRKIIVDVVTGVPDVETLR